jgi:hypothetical protein
MAGPTPRGVTNSEIKSRILNVAQTSVFMVKLQPPAGVVSYLQEKGFNYSGQGEVVELMCCEAELPGSNFFTHDVTSDFAGMSEKMVYRRDYDSTANFSFYVNNRYDVVEMFDGWSDYCAGQNTRSPEDYKRPYVNYRMNFPDEPGAGYRTNIHLTKFEKHVGSQKAGHAPQYALEYTFVNAFPLSVNPVKLSYQSSDLMKYSIGISYSRYVRERVNVN